MIAWIAQKLGWQVAPTIAALVLLGMLMAAIGGGAWCISGWRADSKELATVKESLETYQKQDEESKKVAKELTDQMAKLTAKNRKLNESLNHAIQQSNLGADDQCRWPIEWMPSINEGLTGAPGSQPVGTVPPAGSLPHQP